MELKYIVLTIIKILISVPNVVLSNKLDASLMGGYIENNNDSFVGISVQNGENYGEHYNLEKYSKPDNNSDGSTEEGKSEEIPHPSPLVIPGYNLPENIFNKGKPFYMERDPITGEIDFTNNTKIDDDFYDYSEEEEQSSDIYNKANIDRKDGNIGSHRPSDINQLSPNFHDFLNLPIKYNSDKYVYPLISSSYANTKVQGNVNKYHNHKTHVTKFPIFKPAEGPYLSTTTPHTPNYGNTHSTISSIVSNRITENKKPNQTKGSMHYPNFNDNTFYDFYETFGKNKTQPDFKQEVYHTTKRTTQATTLPPLTTSKKVMSLFEQLFGEYDEIVTTTEASRSSSPTQNHLTDYYGNNELGKNKIKEFVSTTSKPPTAPNVATGSNMEMENLYEEYDDYYYNNQNSSEISSTTKSQDIPSTTQSTTQNYVSNSPSNFVTSDNSIFNSHSYKQSDDTRKITSTGPKIESTTEYYETTKVTSLPLGDHHVSTPKSNTPTLIQHVSSSDDYKPIIIATQNLRDQLNNERVVPKPFSVISQHAPSTSSIHIAPDQDTVSFVVGHHQSMDGESYVEPNNHDLFITNSFQPLYGENNYEKDDIIYNNSPDSVIFQQPQLQNHKEISGSVVTIRTQTNSEASLSIGVPVENVKKIPGQVVDAKLELENIKKDYPTNGGKIVFPNEKDVPLTSSVLSPPTSISPIATSNREILKLASKPMFHQLPSDLTPPKENEGKHPTRMDSPRPPWDPRPGHFFSGKLEYSRPPRPIPDIAYKRIDTLPNILPQFRPNMKSRGPVGTNHYEYKHGGPHSGHRIPPNLYDNRLHREPLLERPSNRPLNFYEKLQPPPLPPKNSHYRKIFPAPQAPELRVPIAQDRKGEDYNKKPPPLDRNTILKPPKVMSNMRRNNGEVETLQMLQAKHSDRKDMNVESENTSTQETNKTDKPVYVVYPVNTSPIKLDVIDTQKKESVVIGTRAELPLPPSEISDEFVPDKNPLLTMIDRNDAPILKPQSRPPNYSSKSSFPYPLERPDISILRPVPEAANNGISTGDISQSDLEGSFISNNQWNTLDANSKIEPGNIAHNIYTEKPIAIAYTPTEPSEPNMYDKYSLPNFGSSNMDIETPDVYYHLPKNEGPEKQIVTNQNIPSPSNHKVEDNNDKISVHTEQNFQAPFQASVKIDSPSQGWSVIRRNDSRSKNEDIETTTVLVGTTSEFDIENFKPQLEGGFKPIYASRSESSISGVDERQE